MRSLPDGWGILHIYACSNLYIHMCMYIYVRVHVYMYICVYTTNAWRCTCVHSLLAVCCSVVQCVAV